MEVLNSFSIKGTKEPHHRRMYTIVTKYRTLYVFEIYCFKEALMHTYNKDHDQTKPQSSRWTEVVEFWTVPLQIADGRVICLNPPQWKTYAAYGRSVNQEEVFAKPYQYAHFLQPYCKKKKIGSCYVPIAAAQGETAQNSIISLCMMYRLMRKLDPINVPNR